MTRFLIVFTFILTGSLFAAEMVPFPIPFETNPESVIQHNYFPITPSSRLISKDGHFVDQTGRKVRIWGVNLSFNANFPEHADAEKLAQRLAAAGVNAVRCHHMDTSPWPRGITTSDYRTLHPEALDRLCYMIDQLARYGIYTNINLHVGAQYSKHLGLPDSQRNYDKVVNIFTPPLIDAQKNYANMLLKYMNPYRKMRLADDPAVAFVEITNENSFFMWDGEEALRNLEPYYRDLLQKQYNQWLRNRYDNTAGLKKAWCRTPDPLGSNFLKNSDFSQISGNGVPSYWQVEQHAGCSAKLMLKNKTLTITPTKIDPTSWHLQFKQTDFTIEEGRYYTLTFTAHADAPRSISMVVGQNHEPWGNLGVSRELKLTSEPQSFRIVFRGLKSDDNARLSFSFGNADGPFYLADIQMKPGAEFTLDNEKLEDNTVLLYGASESQQRLNDRMVFLAETEKKYFDGMYQHIINDIGCNSLVTGTIVFGPLGLYTQSDLDFVDSHAYWQHPRFPGRPWDGNNWIINQMALSAHPDGSTLFQLASERLAGKPYTVSEYNHPAPLDSQSECVPMIASYAALQDWDGIWLYTYCHGNTEWNRQQMNSFFDIDTNPAKWGFMAAGATVFCDSNLNTFPNKKGYALKSNTDNPLLAIADLHLEFDRSFARAYRMSTEELTSNAVAVTFSNSGSQSRLKNNAPGNLIWNVNDKGGLYAASSPQSVILCGATSRFAEFPDFKIQVRAPQQASLIITTLDHRDLKTTRSILITSCGRCENQGMEFSEDRTTVGNRWGKAPVMIEPINATIQLPQSGWTCQPLKADGTPSTAFKLERTLELSPKYATMWYLLTR